MLIKRYDGNPVLGPDPNCPWGDNQSRNPGVIFDGKTFHMPSNSSVFFIKSNIVFAITIDVTETMDIQPNTE